MGLLQTYIEHIPQTESIFDLAALTCDYLYECIPPSQQAQFISQYVDHPLENNAEQQNPNTTTLNQLGELIVTEFADGEFTAVHYYTFIPQLQQALESICLQEYGEPILNEAAVLYTILDATDTLAAALVDLTTVMPNNPQVPMGPLSDCVRYKTLVYYSGGTSLIDEARNELLFRNRASASSITDCVSHLRLIRRSELKQETGIPKIKRIIPPDSAAHTIQAKKVLKIAHIPVSMLANFKLTPSLGSSFTVEYMEAKCATLLQKCIRLIEKAITDGANIIALPELVVSPQMVAGIENYLTGRHGDVNQLIFVIAGSTWENNNNVMHIISWQGLSIGEYYKYSPYTTPATQQEIPTLPHSMFSKCEALKNPGKVCTLVNIHGIGHILPAICRDIIDENYTLSLAKRFAPSMIMAAAWSPSVSSFENCFRELSTQYHVCCFMFNCCQAVKNTGRFSLCCTPRKAKDNSMAGRINRWNNTDECKQNCKTAGCYFMLNADFRTSKVKQGKIIDYKQIIC